MAITDQAQQNREYVRRILKTKQPEYAAVLEWMAWERTRITGALRRAGKRLEMVAAFSCSGPDTLCTTRIRGPLCAVSSARSPGQAITAWKGGPM